MGDLIEVHRIRGASVQRRVAAPSIVEIEIAGEADTERGRRVIGSQVDILVLHAASQSLDENVVEPAPLAIHAKSHAVCL